jgi:serine acetyltransferase/thymidylate kinase
MDERCHVLQALFDFLEDEDVDYCVVGDTRQYPQEISSDVDIVVRRGAFESIARTLARFCRAHDVRLVQMIQHEQTAVYFVIAWHTAAGAPRFLAVDFCSDYFRGGRRLLTADEILMQREIAVDDLGSLKGFYVPPPHMQFIYYLLKKVDKRELHDAHGDYLSNQWREDAGGAWGEVCRFWPVPADAELLAHASATNQWTAVREALPRLQRSLRRAVPHSAAWVFGEAWRRLARALRPTGRVVAFLGPDGSGKSSVIQRVLDELTPVFRRTQRFHLRPRIIPLGSNAAGPVLEPHALTPRGRLASAAKLAYLVLDYVAGYALRVWPLKVRSTLIAFDRYFHDVLVDPLRYRYGGPMKFARWAAVCVPAPETWVLLDAPAAVLQSRKSEVSPEESERQLRDYREFVATREEAIVADASRELDHVVNDVVRGVLDCLARRLETRHPQAQVEDNPLRARLLLFFCRHSVPVLSKLFRILFNSDIYCRIRSPILMPHPYGIVIHSKAQIGRRVTVMQQVTIGGKNPGGENAAPVIEDDVYIGTGAKIIGNLRVGRGAVVGANTVVTRDVPPYCTVVGANRFVHRDTAADGKARVRIVAEDAAPTRETLSA